MNRKRTRHVAVLLATILALGGCSLMGQLSEEAKPVNSTESFIVAVAEFNRLANEANVWIDGVLQQASVGDPAASQYLPVAQRVSQIIHSGNLAIQSAKVAFSEGRLEDFLKDGEAINFALTNLQAELLAAGVGAAGGQ